MGKPNYDVIIPSFVRYDSNLSELSKLLLGEIYVLAVKEGFCWATNSYLSELYNVSVRTIIRSIQNLEENNYIRCEIQPNPNNKNRDIRKIFLTGDKIVMGDKNVTGTGDKNVTENIIQDININNNIEEISNYDWLDD